MMDKEYFAALADVPLRVIFAYMNAHGWTKVEDYAGKGEYWQFAKDGPEVMIPASTAFSDYPLRIWQILDTLSQTEERDSLDILRDLSQANFDLVSVGNADNGHNGKMSLDNALALIQESRNLLWASACSAIRPQPAFLTRGTARVTKYLHTVKVSPSGQNRFQVNLLSPIPPAPFPRQVIDTLTSALAVVNGTTMGINPRNDLQEFDHWVSHWVSLGVSANLCNAVENLVNHENGEGLEISVHWALYEQRSQGLDKFRFTRSDAPYLKEAARILKDHREKDVQYIRGHVISLTRGLSRRRGNATIRASIDGIPRNIRVDFDPADYSRIVHAHDNRHIISLVGTLTPYGRGWLIDNPRDLIVDIEHLPRL